MMPIRAFCALLRLSCYSFLAPSSCTSSCPSPPRPTPPPSPSSFPSFSSSLQQHSRRFASEASGKNSLYPFSCSSFQGGQREASDSQRKAYYREAFMAMPRWGNKSTLNLSPSLFVRERQRDAEGEEGRHRLSLCAYIMHGFDVRV